MSDQTLLCPDDWERLNNAVDVVMDDDRPKREIVADFTDGFREAAASGDSQASRIHHALAQLGGGKVLTQRSRRQTGIFVDSQTGETLNVPVRASVAARGESGNPESARQLRLWRELTWDEFHDWAQHQVHLADSMQLKVRGIRFIQRLHERFPLSRTPGEACAMAGVDPESIDLGEATS